LCRHSTVAPFNAISHIRQNSPTRSSKNFSVLQFHAYARGAALSAKLGRPFAGQVGQGFEHRCASVLQNEGSDDRSMTPGLPLSAGIGLDLDPVFSIMCRLSGRRNLPQQKLQLPGSA
jgi:hypothetical protein